MQAGIPIVTTSIGAEGIPNKQSIFCIADSEETFAKAIDDFYNNETLCHSLTENYNEIIEEHFSEKAIQRFINSHF
jgi:O-antigen biosynthesis protein